MKTEPKYLTILKYLYDKRPKSIHYLELTPIIYDEETIKKWRHHRRHKPIIDGMVCRYMGKLDRKDYASAKYEHIQGGRSYFVGYYIRPNGIKLLKEKGLI